MTFSTLLFLDSAAGKINTIKATLLKRFFNEPKPLSGVNYLHTYAIIQNGVFESNVIIIKMI